MALLGKKNKNKNNNSGKPGDRKTSKAAIFIIEKDGFAYYRDKRLNLVCKKAKLCQKTPYEGYMWKYDYMANLDWFKRYVALMEVNKGNIRFIGMTRDEFFEIGGTLEIGGVEELDISKLKKDINSK